MARARARAAVADVTLLLVDLEAALQDACALDAVEALFDSRAILLLNKADRCDAAAVRRLCESLQDRNPVVISAKTGEGLDLSLERLVEVAGKVFGGGEGEGAAITRLRPRRALEDCPEALPTAQTAALPEPRAGEPRRAARALAPPTRRV